MPHKHQLKQLSISRIAIVRSLPGLGDLLCAIPAFRALRAALPEAHITLIGLPWARSFVERFSHYLNEFIEFPGYPGIPEVTPSVSKLPKFLASVQEQHFDLALQMHGNGIVSNSFTVLLGARINAGFYLPGNYCPDPNYFLPYPDHEPEIWRHLRLMNFLGFPLQGEELEFPLWDRDWELGLWDAFDHNSNSTQSSQDISSQSLLPAPFVCIHPSASVPEKRWSLKNFAVVADELADRGFQIVLTGTVSEAKLTQSLAEITRFKTIDLAGKTSLGTMAALLSRASLLVCNDTGISHLAAALKVKSVVIFTNSSPHRWTPLNRNIHRSLSPRYIGITEVEDWARCKGHSGDNSVSYAAANYLPVTPEMVLNEVENLLTKEVLNVT